MSRYEDQITPPEQTGSAIAKGLGQMALTMAMFIGGSALATTGLRKGTTALLSRLASHKSGLKKAAEYGLKNNASLTAFLSKTNTKVQPLANYLHRAATSSTAINAESTLNNIKSMSGKMSQYRSFDKGQRGALMRKWGSAYFKETAFLAPTFYVMEQNIGVLGEGPEHKEGPAWWNVPGHAINFAKYLPTYVGADAVFRGGGKFVKAGFGTLADKIVDHVPQVIQDSLAKTAESLNRGDYLNTSVGGLPLKNFTAGLGAASEAFQHALGSGRKKLFTQTNKTLSRYKRTGESMGSIYKFAKKAFTEKYDYSYKRILESYEKRKQSSNRNSKTSFESNFDDFLQFMGTRAGTNQYINTVGRANHAAGGKGLVHKAFYNESGKLPYMARLLGLRKAKSSDFSQRVRKKLIGSVYTDIKKIQAGANTKILAERNKTDFIDNVLAKDMYFNERTKSLVDIKKMGPKYWTDKMLHSKLLVLGNKFSVADLFPMKAISRGEMHRVMPVNDLMAVAPSSQTAAFKKGAWSQMGTGKARSHTNIYNFRRTPGLLIRKTGDKNYNLFDAQEGKWEQIGHSLKAALVSDSPKLANVYIQGQMKGTGDLSDSSGGSDNPFFSFMQRHLGMFDGKGAAPSVFTRLRTVLPDKFNSMIDGKHSSYSSYNARNTIKELKQWMGTDLGKNGPNRITKETLNSLMLRVNSLSSKMSKRSFDDVLSDDYYMTEVIDFLNHQGVIKESGLRAGKVLSDNNSLLKVAETIRKRSQDSDFFRESKAVDNILDAVRVGGRGLENRGGIESPVQKIKRYIYEYSVYHSNQQGKNAGTGILDLIQAKVKTAVSEGRVGAKQASEIEFGMFNERLRFDMKKFTTSTIVDPDNLAAYGNQNIIDELKTYSDRHSYFLKKANDYLKQDSISGPGSVLDEVTSQLGMMETTWAMNAGIDINDLVASANMVKNANPFIALPTDIKSVAELGLGWGFNTINKLISSTGLGWDEGKYNTAGGVASLWGKRLGAFAGATVAYTAADTFTDVSGLFDWSFLDEGITVGVADQMVKARMLSGWAYDKMGVDNAARYMEGLMPGSSKVIPGAALGFAMGGIKGAAIGGLANAYLQPQLAEGPLSFLGAVPVLAPFVQDLTKDYADLQDLYSGKDMVSARKGRGWCLTPDDRVQTNYGQYVYADTVKVKDKLVGLDGKTHEVSQILTREVDEAIVQIKPYHTYISPKLTKQHPVLTSLDTKELRWKEAGQVNEKDWLVYKKPLVSSRSKKLRLLHFLDEKLPYLIEGEGPHSKITLLQNQTTTNRSTNTYCRKGVSIPGEFSTDHDLGLFLGWFMAEGTIQHNGNYLIEATYSAEEQYWVDSIITYLKEAWKVRKVTISSPSPKGTVNVINGKKSVSTGQTRRIRFSSVELWSVIKKLCYKGTKKYNNPVFLSFGKEFLKAFLVGWFYGDGHFSKNKKDYYINAAFTSASEQHILQLWNMLLVFDIFGYLQKRNEGQSYRITINAKQLQSFLNLGATKYYTKESCVLQENSFNLRDTFHIKKGRVFIKVKSAEQLHYSGLVYDYTVEESHNFSLEQFIVHNSLGLTPIAGGRIERYEPGWYPRLKAQSQATPTLYGSKLEQFLTRDVPFVDFSLMDIVDPHYLEKKHWSDRPYPIPSTVFSEVPVIGPLAGATVGRLYNSLHPMALGNEMHEDAAQRAYMKGTSTNWKGESAGTHGPQYQGYLGNFNTGNTMAGQGSQKAAIMSPHNIKPLIGEQVYKGWIEPMGLPGFITSATMWGGDEPYTNIPIAESADKMDSLARRYWDAGLGDLAGTTELFRRAVPRPRTSIETVNFLGNEMPTWMPKQFQEGDPYCLTPDTLVETEGALIRADEVEVGTLVKTLHGLYFPVEAIKNREVDEDIFIITIDGIEDFPIAVTGGHPFYINDEWVFAKDLTCQDKVTYPLLNIELPKQITVKDKSIPLNGASTHLAGLLARWSVVENDKVSYRVDTPDAIITEIKYYIDQFIQDPEYYVDLVNVLQNDGMHTHLLSGTLIDLVGYLKAFLVTSETNENVAIFRFHNNNSAYKAWTSLLHHKIPGRVVGNTLIVSGLALVELGYYLNINVKGLGPSEIVVHGDPGFQKASRGPCVYLNIRNIERRPYKGLVYALDVGEGETFTVPGAVVHNSKIANGELLLPGDSYENFFKPSITFPTGASRLGYTPYEQALTMVGLGEFDLDTQETLEHGTAIHEMVQNQLIQTGLATRVEALISDAELDLRSYVDAMYKDPRTGQELPLEIKSIGGHGLGRLSKPKGKHRIQVNSYMAMMGVTQGKFLYVSRDNPADTKEFSVRFDPNLWERTKGDLLEARRLATEFLEQGYGDSMAGYNYIDRMQVLLNANPYSKEYREAEKLAEQKFDRGYLSVLEEERFSKLQEQHKAMMMKYQMYPHRFKVSQLLNPEEEYQNLSQNEHIRPSSDYGIVERIIGSFWEYGTHLRSPLHTKVLGHYSPEEQYENMMLRGDFASWTSPVEAFAKPYARGLRATRDPLQGSVSWGIGGVLLGGGPGAMLGAAVGATYGTLHGMYRAVTGSHYVPDSFRERQEYQEYFDMVEYQRAQDMYEATGNQKYRKQILGSYGGWMNTGGGQGYNLEYSNSNIGYNIGSSPQTRILQRMHNPAAMGMGSDRGFGSPWHGSDPNTALGFETDVNIYNAFSAMPTWDRPFWTAFLEAPEDKREKILSIADSKMGDMLKMAWGRGEEVNLPNPDTFFNSYNRPSSLHPLMSPNVDISDYQTATVLNEGMEAHDFGMGWRDQMLRIKNNPLIQPIDINGVSGDIGAMDMSQGEITDAIRQLLDRMGFVGSTVNVRVIPVEGSETTVTLNVRRTYANEIVKQIHGSE